MNNAAEKIDLYKRIQEQFMRQVILFDAGTMTVRRGACLPEMTTEKAQKTKLVSLVQHGDNTQLLQRFDSSNGKSAPGSRAEPSVQHDRPDEPSRPHGNNNGTSNILVIQQG